MKKTDLCAECAGELTGMVEVLSPSGFAMLAGSAGHREGLVSKILGENARYPVEAYSFVCEALDYCGELRVERVEVHTTHHVSGRELCEAIRLLALKRFGKTSKAVFAQWKIFRTEDFGEIVFDLVDSGFMGKTAEDSKKDFENGYKFDEAFPEQ